MKWMEHVHDFQEINSRGGQDNDCRSSLSFESQEERWPRRSRTG